MNSHVPNGTPFLVSAHMGHVADPERRKGRKSEEAVTIEKPK